MALGDLNWIMAISIMFGLALVMTLSTYKNIETFFVFLTIFGGFAVWSGLIDTWILVLLLIILALIIANNVNKRGKQ